jgi:hypothetical protein
LLKRANLLWKTLEQMFGSSNDKKSLLTCIPESILSSSINIDQDQEEQSSLQKENVKSVSLGKPDGLISQTGVSDFGRIKNDLTEEDDCSILSSDNDNDDEELLLEFQKLISKHIKL